MKLTDLIRRSMHRTTSLSPLELQLAAPSPLHAPEIIPHFTSGDILLPALTPEQLLVPYAQDLERIRHCIGYMPDEFARFVAPLFVRFAGWVHLLPASRDHHHSHAGGLLEHSIQVARFAAQSAQGMMLGIDHVMEIRRQVAQRYKLAIMIAGLLHDLGKALVGIVAQSADGQLEWPAETMALYSWLQREKLQHYRLRWKSGHPEMRHENAGIQLGGHLLPDALVEHLHFAGNREIFEHLIEALPGGQKRNGNPLLAPVKKADIASVEYAISQSAALFRGDARSLRSIAARVVRAIQRDHERNNGVVNARGALVWVTDEGVFGLYPDIIREAIALLEHEGDTDVPRSVRTVMGILRDARFITPYTDPIGGIVGNWQICLPSAGINSLAIRFTNPAKIFPEDLLAELVPVIIDRNRTGVLTKSAPTAKPMAESPSSDLDPPQRSTVVPETILAPDGTAQDEASAPVGRRAINHGEGEEHLYIKVLVREFVGRKSAKQVGGIDAVAELLLREHVAEFAKKAEINFDWLWIMLASQPRPLLVPTALPNGSREMRIAPSSVKQWSDVSLPFGFYRKYPRL